MSSLIPSLFAAVSITATASAFSLDISSLNGQTLGTKTITNAYGTFTLSAGGTAKINSSESNLAANPATGKVTLGANEMLTVIYPSTVTFMYATLTTSGAALTNNGTLQITASPNGATIIGLEFNPAATSPVPEPSSTALLGLGGAALLLRRRRSN